MEDLKLKQGTPVQVRVQDYGMVSGTIVGAAHVGFIPNAFLYAVELENPEALGEDFAYRCFIAYGRDVIAEQELSLQQFE